MAKSATATTADAAASESRSTGGVTPNQCGSACENETGTGPVSSGGTSTRSVVPTGSSTELPHSGQKRAPPGRLAPQLAQVSAAGADTLMPGFCPRLERA